MLLIKVQESIELKISPLLLVRSNYNKVVSSKMYLIYKALYLKIKFFTAHLSSLLPISTLIPIIKPSINIEKQTLTNYLKSIARLWKLAAYQTLIILKNERYKMLSFYRYIYVYIYSYFH